MTARVGVLGGTFDPIHFGHLDAADAARSALSLDEVLFVPSHDPPHRPIDPRATAFHRFALVALALDGRAGYRVSDVELVREGSSYTSDTLRALHAAGLSPLQLFFIVGADAFAEIATWHEYPRVLDAAHFVVVARPGMTTENALALTPGLSARVRRAAPDADLRATPCIFPIDARTRDVSSTMIRQRIALGHPLEDLVPISVARYIATHHLYDLDDGLHGHHQDK